MRLNFDNSIRLLNILALLGIVGVVGAAFFFQFALQELPCPLCLLQRIGLLAVGFGFLMNIRYGIRPVHYGLSILAAVCTALVALRQISLHIEPGDPGYGSAVFGLHMYSWVFVLCLLAIVFLAILLSLAGQYRLDRPTEPVGASDFLSFAKAAQVAVGLYLMLILANGLSTLLECGLQQCPDNPTVYQLLSAATG